ncbi:MAG: hypothetical protein JRN73_09785, partial [Nitrososphaerota archaeon]|nr:hypothetical protein [Nitrososphaerota archaeon]
LTRTARQLRQNALFHRAGTTYEQGLGSTSRVRKGRDGRKPPPARLQFAAVLGLLPRFKSGGLSVSVNGAPMVRLDSESRVLSIEADGMRQSGIRLGKMLGLGRGRGGVGALLVESEGMARRLSEMGWTLTLYDKDQRLLSMGNRAPRLTGHVTANPLKLGRLLETLR